jgi:hypothetical protein
MSDFELDMLTHPRLWVISGLLPVFRRGGDPVKNWKQDAALITADNICRVWVGVLLGEHFPSEGTPVEYASPEALLKVWTLD